MHPLQNGSQVDNRPARKPTQGTAGYFSESNEQGAPSYPGQDYFNDQIEEFENALAVMGIPFVPGDTDHLAKMFAAVKNTYPDYDATTVYSYGDVVRREINGVYKLFEWYSNVESLAGKDPADTANRRPGWSDTTKPFYWKPYTTKLAGETMAWDDDNLPEIMMVGAGQQVSALTYHTLAAAKPQWIDGVDPNLLNIPDRQGRFDRAADGTTWLAGQTHEDAIRNIEAEARVVVDSFDLLPTGAFEFSPLVRGTATSGSTDSIVDMRFDASLVVPTADENQPKGFIEWKGYAL
ncbi:hypothetical protein [Vibrio hepatarius]|uniref:hypothetical protein n=1 Tax=Vibrio hepatarius TaxID=171383 RepID=UPI00148E0FA3|nr:hypothetical protein [Vibrio hepatarius]NOI14847.1 hypothetical protein [Vibrio hepatarius]